MSATAKPAPHDETVARAASECISALAMLVANINKLIEEHPEFKDRLLPAVTQLGEALPCAARFLSIDFDVLEVRLSAVESAVEQLKIDVAQLQIDVAQLKIDVAQLTVDVAQLKADVAQLKSDVAQLKGDMTQLKGVMTQLKGDTTQLKDDFADLKTDMAVVKATLTEHSHIFLTKEEFHKEMHKMTWRIYGWMAGLTGAVYCIARYVH